MRSRATSIRGAAAPRTHGAVHLGSWLTVLALAGLILLPNAGMAATPASGTLTPSSLSVTWTGALIAGTTPAEADCIEGVNCDTYVLTLAPGDYTGKRIVLGINWTAPTNDYDMYVHEGSPNGPIVTQSADFVPDNQEDGTIPIDPPIVLSAKTYYVHSVAFAVTVPGHNGFANLVNVPAARSPIYLAGSSTFSPNITLKAPVAGRDGEPSCRIDVRGNCYVGGIRGVPAGVDLWRFDLNPASPSFDAGLQNPTYLGQPDAFLPQDPDDPTTGGADGGGDIDIAVSFPASADSIPVLTIVSLAAANISSAFSFDRGETFTLSPATAIAPADDRQWIECFGANTVYMLYRAPIPATGLFSQRSDDHGLTYAVTGVVNPSGTTPGYIDVDHASGRVYAAHMGSNTLVIANSIDGGLTWRNNTADNTTSHGSLFDVVKVGDDGTVYGLWADQSDIYLVHSTDGGQSWSERVRVNENSVYRTNLFPWLEAGSAGRVAIVWYGSPSPTNDDGADWVVLMSHCLDATAPNPTFRQQVISDHVIHGSNISLGGLTGALNRNLIDYFQVALDPQGAVVVAYTDDHNDFDGHVYVTRQLDGPSAFAAANGTGFVNPVYPPALPGPAPGDPEVSDFLHDAVAGLLQPIVTDSPLDILWINYECEPGTSGDSRLVAMMKLSDLAVPPAATSWRVNFAANCPGGVSDRGDQFYMRVSTDNATSPAFTFGTAVRGSAGAVVYTERGTCLGLMDTANDLITFSVALSQLNPFVTIGPPLAPGSVLHGLRGSTFSNTPGASALRDMCRGGTMFTFPDCGPVPAELLVFSVENEPQGLRVTWQFADAAEFSRVTVERALSTDGAWEDISGERAVVASSFSIVDPSVTEGATYWYRLSAVTRHGEIRRFGPLSAYRGAVPTGPLAAFVGPPAPNPTRGAASIQFRVNRPGFVELSVFDVAGRRIRTIQAGAMAPGAHDRTWDGRTDQFEPARSGVYFFVLNTADGVTTERVMLAR